MQKVAKPTKGSLTHLQSPSHPKREWEFLSTFLNFPQQTPFTHSHSHPSLASRLLLAVASQVGNGGVKLVWSLRPVVTPSRERDKVVCHKPATTWSDAAARELSPIFTAEGARERFNIEQPVRADPSPFARRHYARSCPSCQRSATPEKGSISRVITTSRLMRHDRWWRCAKRQKQKPR